MAGLSLTEENSLFSLRQSLSNYFLGLTYWPAGKYWCIYDKCYEELEKDTLFIDRPKEDWSFAVVSNGDHFECRVNEAYSGSELYRFCFVPGMEVEAILELVSNQQSFIGNMIDLSSFQPLS